MENKTYKIEVTELGENNYASRDTFELQTKLSEEQFDAIISKIVEIAKTKPLK